MNCGYGCEVEDIHCWRLVRAKGIVGYVGCHENFATSVAYWTHISRGACRNPRNIDTLRWSGVSWEVKEEDERRRA